MLPNVWLYQSHPHCKQKQSVKWVCAEFRVYEWKDETGCPEVRILAPGVEEALGVEEAPGMEAVPGVEEARNEGGSDLSRIVTVTPANRSNEKCYDVMTMLLIKLHFRYHIRTN